MAGKLPDRTKVLIRKYSSDFLLFCRECLKILPSSGTDVIPFVPRVSQLQWLDARIENPKTYILKSRKLGMTTMVAAWNFWRALFRPNYRVMLMAQDDDAVLEIFEVYKRFYDHLPAALKFPMKSKTHWMKFGHGSVIRAKTTSTESQRGGNYHAIHCSEFAFYRDIEKTIKAAFNIVGDRGEITLETTPNGVNFAHHLWFGQNAYEKVFISWMNDPSCRSKKPPDVIPAQLDDLQVRFKLDRHQLWWACHTFGSRCASDWNFFLQEYCVEPLTAFICAGRRFFSSVIYSHAKSFRGYRCYLPVNSLGKFSVPMWHAYTIGIDTASGLGAGDSQAKTDYSCFVVIDVTDKKKPFMVSSFYDRLRPDEFAAVALKEAKRFNALGVIELNSWGHSVQNHFLDEGYTNLYRKEKFDKVRDRWSETVGFTSNKGDRRWLLLAKMQQYIANGWFKPTDERLKAEINTFVYDDTGKPVAQSTNHDDMIIATGLALMGMDQIDAIEQRVKHREKPEGLREILEFERETGLLYRQVKQDFWPDHVEDDASLILQVSDGCGLVGPN